MTNLRSVLGDPQFPALVERLEAAAWLEAAGCDESRRLDSRVVDGTILIVDRGAEGPVSRAFLLGIERPVTTAILDDVIAAFATAEAPSFSVALLPTARPTQAPRLLERAGFKRGPQQAAVVRPSGGMEPADPFFRIRAAVPEDSSIIEGLMVETGGATPDWTHTFSRVIGGSNWRANLAFEGSRPYALGGFFYRGETALLFTRSWVLPGYETRGVQTALVQTALRDAESLGCRWVVSVYPVTAETRMRGFQRMGFEVIFQRRVYFYGAEPPPNELTDPLSRGPGS